MGLAQFDTTADHTGTGAAVAPLKAMAEQQRRLRRHQKSVSRKKTGSCNRRKAIERLSRLHAIAVNPAFRSQRCWACGYTDKGNRATQSSFICLACGHAENADVNAAKNILAAGHAAWSSRTKACAEDVRHAKPERAKRAASVKQEPAKARKGQAGSLREAGTRRRALPCVAQQAR